VKQFARSLAVRTVSSGWPLFPLSVSRALLGVARLGVSEPVEAPGGRAVGCVSVDFDAMKEGRLELNRRGTRVLVELSMRHGVPMTWAVCGRTAEEDPRSYHMVQGCEVSQEVAVHTYSHIDVSRCTEDELALEVDRCIAVLGLKEKPRTFIFPWNKEGHFDALRKMGFTAYRGEERGIGRPAKATGLWNIRPVHYLSESSYGLSSYVTRLMDLCVSTRSVFHIWLHPWSVVGPTPEAYRVSVLEPVFSYMAGLRDAGAMEIMTMGEMAKSLEAAASSQRGPYGLIPSAIAPSQLSQA
jgi:peptidoglycan/xylan/chitin deacetylase (PgdA/CDA1 family)